MIREIISLLLILVGTTFILISAIGVVRMPDLYLRMSSSTKSSTLGVGMIMLAIAVHFAELGIFTRALATIVFLFLTAPVSAHMIGRAGYFKGVPLWSGTRYDHLKGHYDLKTHALHGSDEASDNDTALADSRQSNAI